MSIYAIHHELGGGGAVQAASDRIVSINVARAAAVTPQLVGHRHGE